MGNTVYSDLTKAIANGKKLLAILIDPDKFDTRNVDAFLKRIPKATTHLFVGGSTATNGHTQAAVQAFRNSVALPIVLFPGHHSQITATADALLFLSLLSGRNAEYLIGQQVKAVDALKNSSLETIATGYILIDGGNQSAVARVSGTQPLCQNDVQTIVHTALAGQYMGAKLLYLEAGSGAAIPVAPKIISEVKKAIAIPLIVGGGIKTQQQLQNAHNAGADLVVMGTAFETI
jgi:putative glycerol-1-phosphate prenyltransferase